jgi:general L-amino acid transport system substrate-binding protein
MPVRLSSLVGGALLAAGLAASAHAQAPASPTLDAVTKRGQLACGVSTGVAGFSMPDSQGVERGIDADSCRVVAAAALGDANKVKFVPLTAQNRFTALQSGEVDVLIRSTTWTLGREGSLGLLFAWVNYYDGTGFLVKKSANVNHVKELDGATVCVQPGTTTELAISDYFRNNNLKFTPVLIQDLNEIQKAFTSGRCDAYSTDSSALATFRYTQPKPDDYTLLPELISKEPLGVMVRKGDDKWFDVVRWSFIAQVTAEEDGVTSKNADDMLANSKNPDVRRLLGAEGDMGKQLGIDNKWGLNIVKQVGNFGEMWDRNITPMGVPRGINNLWTKGGLQYAPPIR